jgi:hypothetical protein
MAIRCVPLAVPQKPIRRHGNHSGFLFITGDGN